MITRKWYCIRKIRVKEDIWITPEILGIWESESKVLNASYADGILTLIFEREEKY